MAKTWIAAGANLDDVLRRGVPGHLRKEVELDRVMVAQRTGDIIIRRRKGTKRLGGKALPTASGGCYTPGPYKEQILRMRERRPW
jgi:hypothetical protein